MKEISKETAIELLNKAFELVVTYKSIVEKDPAAILTFQPTDFKELSKKINEVININVTDKSLKALTLKVRAKNTSINVLCAFLLVGQKICKTEDIKFTENSGDNRYFVRKYFELTTKPPEKTDIEEALPAAQKELAVTNKNILLIGGLPFVLLILKIMSHAFSWSNTVALYFIILAFVVYFRWIDKRMGFSFPVVGTLIFLSINTVGYFFSDVVMPNYYFTLNKDFAELYYWGLTTTNILLNACTMLNFIGYANVWKEREHMLAL